MFKSIDPFTHTLYGKLIDQNAPKKFQDVGILSVQYHVSHYNNVQMMAGILNQGTATPNTREYIITCTQRITLFNHKAINLGPTKVITAYENYPAIIQSSVAYELSTGQTNQLMGYSPQTINTQVQSSGSSGSSNGESTSSSQSKTSGSSKSQTNSYSANAGLTGDIFSFGVSTDSSSTSSVEHSNTATMDNQHNNSKNASSSASMNIKDWSVYSYVNPADNSTNWNFAQEYPWDVLECRSMADDMSENSQGQVKLQVPGPMLSLLYNNDVLFPPSHLSSFGMTFTTQLQSKIIIENKAPSEITLNHNIDLYTASHELQSSAVAVYMDKSPTPLCLKKGNDTISTTLDLSVMALDPIQSGSSPAIVGFVPSKFTTQPNPASSDSETKPVAFNIFSDSNKLKISDTTQYPTTSSSAGFNASQTALTATLNETCSSLTLSVLFKVTDTVSDYTLFLKHWKTMSQDVTLTIVVNGDSENAITKHVDALEAEGGEKNLLEIALRNQNFSSVEYTDLLVLGLNSIDINISSTDTTKDSGYALRALSIEPH